MAVSIARALGSAGALRLRLACSVTGSGHVTLTGTVATGDYDNTGSGDLRAQALTAETVIVDLDNGAAVTVCAMEQVMGTVANGADLVVECGGEVSGVSVTNGGSVR